MEIVIIFFLIVWVLLYFVENSAMKKNTLAKYAWLARATKPLLFFGGIGFFVAILGTDWNNRPGELMTGTALILIGLVLFIRTYIKRKQIQKGLETGTVKPISGSG